MRFLESLFITLLRNDMADRGHPIDHLTDEQLERAIIEAQRRLGGGQGYTALRDWLLHNNRGATCPK